mgnify:FL=1
MAIALIFISCGTNTVSEEEQKTIDQLEEVEAEIDDAIEELDAETQDMIHDVDSLLEGI